MQIYSYVDALESELEVIAELDRGGSYEFDKVVAWRHKPSGRLFFGQDAGCSCPYPFENDWFESPTDTSLTEITNQSYADLGRLVNGYGTVSEIGDFLRAVRDAMHKQVRM